MTPSQIQVLIDNLRQQTAANSITPIMLANILTALNENSAPSQAEPETPAGMLSGGMNWFFGHLCQATTTAGMECPLTTDDNECSMQTGNIVDIPTNDTDEPLVRALQTCFVEVSGFITLKVNDSYTADRIIEMYKFDTEGERTELAFNAVHFTGNTQIFSVPINYKCLMTTGETLHLTHFSSSGSSIISYNSMIYITATPV